MDTHQQRLQHLLVGMRSEAACIEEPLLQNQPFSVSEIEELEHGIQRGGGLRGCHSVHHLRSESSRDTVSVASFRSGQT